MRPRARIPAAPDASTASGADDAAGDDVASAGKAQAPDLDVVRVEPDGSMVVAGRAGPGETIDIIIDGKVVQSVTADAAGEFAAVLSEPMGNGAHSLALSARAGDGEPVSGKQQVAIEIPGGGKAPLVVVQDDASGPQIVQAPDSGGDTQQLATAQQGSDAASDTGSGSGSDTGADQGSPASGDGASGDMAAAGTASDGSGDVAAAGDAGDADAPQIFIRAFEVSPADAEGINELALVGEAPTGSIVRVYVDDELAGDAKADANGRWALKVRRKLPAGRHSVRADMLGEGGSQVVARAQVRFDRVELVAAGEGTGQDQQQTLVGSGSGAEAPGDGAPAGDAATGDAGSGAASSDAPGLPTLAAPAQDGSAGQQAAADAPASADASGDAAAADTGTAPAADAGTAMAGGDDAASGASMSDVASDAASDAASGRDRRCCRRGFGACRRDPGGAGQFSRGDRTRRCPVAYRPAYLRARDPVHADLRGQPQPDRRSRSHLPRPGIHDPGAGRRGQVTYLSW